MGKKNKHLTVKNSENGITLRFDTMFYVKAARREIPPPTKVEMPKKGKGSYDRKVKYKGRSHSENDGISFYFYNNIALFLENSVKLCSIIYTLDY